MSHSSTFGAWVRQRRKALGLTQADLAKHVGCSSEMIRKVEMDKRRPSAQIAELLARCLEIPAAEQAAFLRAARLARRDADAPEPDISLLSDRMPPASNLIGREQLAAHVCQHLRRAETHVLTLAGPAGVGKTALANYVAEQARGGFADGALVVSLVTVDQPEHVLPAIVEALGLPETSTQAPLDQLIAHLRRRQMLLVLDNMEQVVASASALGALLAECPAVTALITSRVPLRMRDEHIVEVPALDLPAPTDAINVTTLLRSSAAALFVVRAHEARPDFVVTERNAAAIAAICRFMDGLPLAIELVAARSNVLDPLALLDRLTGSHGYSPLELPKNMTPALAPRHQTLRDAIGWSFDLLSGPQQHLFTWLGVFNGGFTLAAAEAVCTSDMLRPVDVLDGLQALIDAHLILRQPAKGDELRFTMLVTIRQYALDQLDAAGEREAARAAHGNYYLAFAEQMRAQFQKTGQEPAMDRLEREHDNLRAAIRSALEHDIAQAAQFGAALWWFWYVRSHWREGYHWLEQILSRIQQLYAAIPDAIHARVLRGAGALAEELASYEQAAAWATESLTISRAAENWQGVIATLNNLGGLYHLQGQSDRARRCFEEALDLSRTTNHMVGVGSALGCLGSLATELGAYAEAQAYLDESLAVMRGLNYPFGVMSAMFYLAELALARSDYERAKGLYTAVLTEQRQQNHWQDVALSLLGLGWISYYQDDPRQALAEQQEALRMCQEQGARGAIMLCLEGCAASAGALRMIEAAHLYEAATAERARLGTPRQWTQRQALDRAMIRAASFHDSRAWDSACAQGRAMAFDQAVTLALAL